MTASTRRLAINRLKDRGSARRGGDRPLPGPARAADRRGRPVHVRLPRRGRRGVPACTGWSACPTSCRCAGSRHRSVVGGGRAPAGVTGRVPVRGPPRRALGALQRPAQPAPVARSPVGDSSVCYATGYVDPDWASHDPEARPGELVELDRAEPGAAPRRPGHALPAGPLPAHHRVPAAGRARRRRLPAVRVGQDRAGQPDPPAGHGRAGGRVPAPRRPAGGVRRLAPRTPASSPASCCRTWSDGSRSSASRPGAA